ncbi:hypothetical protein KC349_g294 [Hortaea werneckii]|nr:hypothetical protein KC349_g294 [Hortaea werneckii]
MKACPVAGLPLSILEQHQSQGHLPRYWKGLVVQQVVDTAACSRKRLSHRTARQCKVTFWYPPSDGGCSSKFERERIAPAACLPKSAAVPVASAADLSILLRDCRTSRVCYFRPERYADWQKPMALDSSDGQLIFHQLLGTWLARYRSSWSIDMTVLNISYPGLPDEDMLSRSRMRDAICAWRET